MKQILMVCLLSFIICNSQNTVENRKAFVLEIAANEEQQYKAEIDKGPYFVKDKVLQLYCGEKVLVECEIVNDTIASMKVVEKNLNPKKTIEIAFTQDSKDRKQIITTLLVKNPFERELTYEAIMLTPMSKNWKKTSILPVPAKLMGYETWPHAIISLALMKWTFK